MANYIFLDTNIVFNDFHFESLALNKLLSLNEFCEYEIKITELNFKEIIKKYKDEITPVIKDLNGSRSNIKKYKLDNYFPLSEEALVKKDIVADYKEFFKEFLDDNDIEIINSYSSDSMSSIIAKYFSNEKPFDSNKNSFPDAIIWETIKEFSSSIAPDDYIYLISQNTKDFANKENTDLDEVLKNEIPNCTFIKSLEDFFDLPQIQVATSTDFSEFPESMQRTIAKTFSEYADLEFQDYLSSYLLNNNFEGDYFTGWGDDLYINISEIELTEVLEKDGNIVFISYWTKVDSDFDITTLNPIYEKGYDDVVEQYISESTTKVFHLHGSFAYDLVNNTIDNLEIEID